MQSGRLRDRLAIDVIGEHGSGTPRSSERATPLPERFALALWRAGSRILSAWLPRCLIALSGSEHSRSRFKCAGGYAGTEDAGRFPALGDEM
ncbi:hypothetical protein [Burkholderia lata]|uniref:hypothetical protein n=1 Tax=Burkholderia lata (strain ATCC 17760 / DSM 23089 / LMG 22485 / NCIMB 9086 / R18194 / 383) TaxID=482957 RepID=UPI001581BDB0|nr:hypothetical protein [Burkholderia lata]